jgi:hypothetical protein
VVDVGVGDAEAGAQQADLHGALRGATASLGLDWYSAWSRHPTTHTRRTLGLASRSWSSASPVRAGWHGSPRGSPPAVTRWILWYALDSAADLSSTNSTQEYLVDLEHQPTDLAVGVRIPCGALTGIEARPRRRTQEHLTSRSSERTILRFGR